jgi:hypothetical protein
MDAAPFHTRGKGAPRLLEHCAAFARITGSEGLSARARLERELGCELADLLVDALANGPQRRPAHAA